MAEHVGRRIAAARLAVAFVAAGTIAGAAAWAQADPAPTARSSAAVDYFLKNNVVDSSSIVNGSLLFKDFKKGQIPSALQFHKLQRNVTKFNKLTNASIGDIKGELAAHKAQIDGIKGELSSFVKLADADSRYVKVTDSIVRGDGSVFTASTLLTDNSPSTLLQNVPGMFTVQVTKGTFVFTNTSGGDLSYSPCPNGIGGQQDGVLASSDSLTCPVTAGASTESIQFFSWGKEVAATVSFSSLKAPSGGGEVQNTVQILIGL